MLQEASKQREFVRNWIIQKLESISIRHGQSLCAIKQIDFNSRWFKDERPTSRNTDGIIQQKYCCRNWDISIEQDLVYDSIYLQIQICTNWYWFYKNLDKILNRASIYECFMVYSTTITN